MREGKQGTLFDSGIIIRWPIEGEAHEKDPDDGRMREDGRQDLISMIP